MEVDLTASGPTASTYTIQVTTISGSARSKQKLTAHRRTHTHAYTDTHTHTHTHTTAVLRDRIENDMFSAQLLHLANRKSCIGNAVQ